MTKLGPYEVHPLADALPLIEGEEFEHLVLDIKKNGLREPILLSHDWSMLIDGRNRYRACVESGVDPILRPIGVHYTETMILDLIVSKNLARRHLDVDQRAQFGLKYKQSHAAAMHVAEAARKVAAGGPTLAAQNLTKRNATNLDPGKSPPEISDSPQPRRPRAAADLAAAAVGVSRNAIERAHAIQRDAPDLADKVLAGQMAAVAADRERKQRIAAMPKPEPVKPTATLLTLRTHDGKEVTYPKPQGRATFNQTSGAGISWAEWSWNPVTGCLHGCTYCYAREIATTDRLKDAYPVGFTPLFHHERLDAPANTTIPVAHRGDPAWRRVFVCSMADLYGRWVPDEWIQAVHTSMCASPDWQYITLTKFPARYIGLKMPPGAWVGTSVDEQNRVRIAEDAFRQIDGVAVKWLSLEPLRAPLEFTDLSMFDWVVIGAQTETRQPGGVVPAFAPPFEWVARLVIQAREAGCRIHLKPNLLGRTSPRSPGMQLLDEYPEHEERG